MRNREKTDQRKKPTVIDIFIIVSAILLLVAVVGQDVAVYMLNRSDRSQRFRIEFVIPSIESGHAEQLRSARVGAETMNILFEKKELGSVDGGFTTESTGSYVTLRGVMKAQGKSVDGECRVYGFDRLFRSGDRLFVTFENAEGSYSFGCMIEIRSVEQINAA